MKTRPNRGPAGDAQTRVGSRAPAPFVSEREGPRDECGVFGIYGPELDVARLTYFGLYALQHRGQESAGIATSEHGHITTQRELGLVSQVFDERSLQALTGDMAIGHVRYSTTGRSGWENSQPVYRHDRRPVALAHNGNLINAVELHNELTAQGVRFRSTSDSEIIAALIASHPAERVEDAVAEVMGRLRGAYSTVIMTGRSIVAFRDPAGVRPLCLGQAHPGSEVVRCQLCVGAESLEDGVDAGQMVGGIDVAVGRGRQPGRGDREVGPEEEVDRKRARGAGLDVGRGPHRVVIGGAVVAEERLDAGELVE